MDLFIRFGVKATLEYKIDAPKGEYQVELLMADVTKPATQLPNLLARSNGEASSKDARFDVSINGERRQISLLPMDAIIAQPSSPSRCRHSDWFSPSPRPQPASSIGSDD